MSFNFYFFFLNLLLFLFLVLKLVILTNEAEFIWLDESFVEEAHI